MVRNSKVTDTSQRVNHNRMIVRRILSVLLSVLILMPAFGGIRVYAEEPTRQINLVYDDSGSMIREGRKNPQFVDRWCQAKYALEVFAGMLGEKDKLDVYFMSDFEGTDTAKPQLQLDGKNGSVKNVGEVHKKTTVAGNTPFNTVRCALRELNKSKADEKWLVILTDGAFQDNGSNVSISSVYDELCDEGTRPSDVKVMYLGMGDAKPLQEDPSRNIYSMQAKSSADILSKLTTIGTQVFNKAELPKSGTEISFDVPMKQLVVFAQGKDVTVNGIKSESGSTYTCNPVNVRYSEKATEGHKGEKDFDPGEIKNTIDTDLCGSMATFNESFPEGKYTIDVKGADTISVYYQPDVDIIARLTKDGEELTDLSNLEAGDYTINFDIVKAGTKESVSGSKLLGNDVKYDATVINNGKEQHDVHSGDTITVEEGDFSIDATATYLKYYTVHTSLNSAIFKDKEVAFTKTGDKVHHLTKKGFTKEDETTPDEEPTQIAVTLDGKEPTPDQWAMMDVPELSENNKLLNFRIEKSETPGIYNVYPELVSEKPEYKPYKNTDVNLSYAGTAGEETWAGEGKAEISISDDRPWWMPNLPWLIGLIIAAIITAILLGYVPGIKHYLPRKLKKRPMITSKKIGSYERPPKPTNGQLEKSLASTLIPYVAERGTIRYVPKGIAGAPKLQVKGSKKGRMEITNIRDFSKKKNISFDGERGDRLIEDMGNKKKFTASAGLTMTSEINGVKYTCSLNE